MKINKIKIKGNDNLVNIDSPTIYLSSIAKLKIEAEPVETKNVFTKKLLEVFDLMNKYLSNHEKINFDVLANLMHLTNSNYLLQYINKEKEPDFAFIEVVADTLGVNSDWLKFSQGNIFSFKSLYAFNHLDIINYLKKHPQAKIIILISEEVEAQVMILVYDNIYKYQRFQKIYPFHQFVGAQGKSDIFDFYKFAKFLNTNNDFYLNTDTYSIRKEIFDAILIGKCFPGAIWLEKSHLSHFWEDLLDLKYEFFKKDQYLEMYGSQFEQIQNIIINKLHKEI